TGAIAEASGLPASFVGALVGGGSVKDAMKAYEKSVTTEAISKATGIPGWYLDQKMAEKEANHAMTTSFSYNMATSMVGSLKYSPPLLAAQALIPGLKEDVNKFVDHVGREAYKNRETIDTAVTVAMTVAAPFSGGASLVALAAYKAAEGAVEGGVLGALAGAANVGNAFLYEFTGGTVSYNLSYSYADGFGASIGGGWKIANGLGVGATLSYNENQGFGGSVGLQVGTSALSFNAGLSYSQRDGVSANAGVGIGLGGKKPTGSLNLGVSYNRQDGLGTSVGISSNNNKITHGMGLNITRSEYGGWGADVSTDNYGPGNLSGGLAYTQRDGFTVSLNVNGTNAFNYNSQSGLSGNGDFMSQYVMNNGLAQGVSDESDTSEPNSAQQHNNAEQGAQAIAGAGETLLGGRRNEGEGGATHYYDKDGNMRIRVTDSNGDSYYRAATAEEAHRIQNNNGYTMASDTGVSRQLSAADIAEFKADWRKESPAQTDASLAALKSAGYDTSGLEKFVQDYRNNKAANSSQGTTTSAPQVHSTQGSGLFTNAYNAVVGGAKDLWNKVTGGGTSVTHSDIENGKKIVSAAEDLLKQHQEAPFGYKIGKTGQDGLMDCTGYVYRSVNTAGFEHIPYMGGSRIQTSPLYQEIPASQRIPGDIKIVTVKDSNGTVKDGHAMIYNGGNAGKEFYEMTGGRKPGIKISGDYLEKHYEKKEYKDEFLNDGYYMEKGYYRPKLGEVKQ
uniref:hypothetical protein n=1 Tax=Leptospira interrogans TaxID=173 RepID=UPI00077344B3